MQMDKAQILNDWFTLFLWRPFCEDLPSLYVFPFSGWQWWTRQNYDDDEDENNGNYEDDIDVDNANVDNDAKRWQ